MTEKISWEALLIVQNDLISTQKEFITFLKTQVDVLEKQVGLLRKQLEPFYVIQSGGDPITYTWEPTAEEEEDEETPKEETNDIPT